MAAIMENTLFLFSVDFITVQPRNERSTKEGTGTPGARTACLFYNQNAAYVEKRFYKSLYLITRQVSGIIKKPFLTWRNNRWEAKQNSQRSCCSPLAKPKPESHPMASPLSLRALERSLQRVHGNKSFVQNLQLEASLCGCMFLHEEVTEI